ncbi:MAG: hypothetical protein QM791_01875 [Ferruginibacter sp.]
MKLKMLKLMLLFLTVGLISSSRENSKCCSQRKCDVDNSTIESSGGAAIGTFGADIEKPMTPGNFLFFY